MRGLILEVARSSRNLNYTMRLPRKMKRKSKPQNES
jgi:hypothetical protein